MIATATGKKPIALSRARAMPMRRVRARFHVDVPLRALFDSPRISALAARIDGSARNP